MAPLHRLRQLVDPLSPAPTGEELPDPFGIIEDGALPGELAAPGRAARHTRRRWRRPPAPLAAAAVAAVALTGANALESMAAGTDSAPVAAVSRATTNAPTTATSSATVTEPPQTGATTAPVTDATSTSAPTDIPASSVTGPAGAWHRSGMPVVAYTAYRRAASRSCAPWWLIAGIGQVESGHAASGRVDENGRVRGAIYGPRLDGSQAGMARIADSDQGRLDADPVFDRAVGPMQFLPATWADVGRDGNGDGVADPQNIFDAAQATAAYLCRFGPLNTEANVTRAILAYNGSDAYVKSVLAAAESYGGPVFPPTPTATAPGPKAPVAPPAPSPAPVPTPRPASTPASTSPKPAGTPSPTPTTATTSAAATGQSVG